MNDYTEMRKRLKGMTDRDFETFISDFYGVDLVRDGDSKRWLELDLKTGGSRAAQSPKEWRQDWTEDILAFKRTKPEEWDRVCSESGILEDSIGAMNLARRSNRFALFASIVAAGALAASIYSIFK